MVAELVLATANPHKIVEIRAMVPQGFTLIKLADVGITSDLPETSFTIPGNALQKAREVFRLTGKNCLADDSGLIVHALGDQPGVNSAFYAGLPKNDERNIIRLLKDLEGKTDRKAYFLTVMALISEGHEYQFEGILNGTIAHTPNGTNGFGYDPVFIPDGHQRTLAEFSTEEKNAISHRSIALKKVVEFLANNNYMNRIKNL